MPIYIKFDGVEGPVTGKYKGWIELQSCEYTVHKAGSSGTATQTRRRGVATDSSLIVTKFRDCASPKLVELLLTGKIFGKVSLDYTSASNFTYIHSELKQVIVSSYAVSGSGGNDRIGPLETIGLVYEAIKREYFAKPDDQKANDQRVMWHVAH